MEKILIVGGAGYVGTELVDMLVTKYKVTVYDLFIYGDNIINHENLTKLKGDVRNQSLLQKAIKGQDYVIHLSSSC